MSSGSSPTTYIPEPAAPTVTRSVTPQRDYQYAANYLDKLETERKALEQKTWNELSDVYRQETAKEDQYYRDSLAKDEPDYTAGLDPYQLNTIASQVYGGGAAAALEDLRNRRSREYVAVAGANPMGRPPAPAAPIPVTIPDNLFTPTSAPPPPPAPPPAANFTDIAKVRTSSGKGWILRDISQGRGSGPLAGNPLTEQQISKLKAYGGASANLDNIREIAR